MFTSLLSGFLIDRFGVVKAIYVTIFFVVLGQLIVTIAAYTSSYGLFFFGRIVFSFGLEPLNQVKNILFAHWFFSGELSFASNLNLGISRMFVFASGAITPWIDEKFGFTQAFIFGLLICIVSLISSNRVANLQQRLGSERILVPRSSENLHDASQT